MMSARTRHRLNRRLGRLKTVFGALLHRRNYKTLLLGTSFGQGSILAVIAVIAVFIATALFFGYRTGDEADKDFMEFAWTAYIFFVDPGSHTELSSDSNTQVEISIGVLISWIGFIWMMMVFDMSERKAMTPRGGGTSLAMRHGPSGETPDEARRTQSRANRKQLTPTLIGDDVSERYLRGKKLRTSAAALAITAHTHRRDSTEAAGKSGVRQSCTTMT